MSADRKPWREFSTRIDGSTIVLIMRRIDEGETPWKDVATFTLGERHLSSDILHVLNEKAAQGW